jgi:hypothetical protein
MAINTWGETLNSWNDLISTVLATITIQGIPDGDHLITLYNDTTDALVFDGILTFTSTVATVELAGNGSTIYTGTWLGDNPPTTGAGLYGTGSSIDGVANGFNGEPDVTAPVITVSGSPTTTIAFGATLPVFTSSTDDGSAVVVNDGGLVNNVAASYAVTFNSTDLAGNIATEVVRTVVVQAEFDITAPVITVSGSSSTTITVGGTEPTFTATADDGSTVVVTGSVNAAVAGTYYYYYNSTDADGNIATQVVRTVIVQSADPVDYSAIEFEEKISTSDIFYERIDQVFAASYETSRDVDNNITYRSLDEYVGAEYYIYNSAGVRIVSLSIGNGITKSGTDFIIHVPNAELNFTGNFEHILIAVSSNRRDLVFNRSLLIRRGF